MELKKKIGLLMLFIITTILFLNTKSYAGTQTWNALDYDVTVNSDGSMDIIETWDVYISETNTLFKDFEISTSDDCKITDVKVSQVENNEEIPLEQIYEEQYYVDSGCYYGLQIEDSVFEIAWNVDLDDSSDTRIYKMYYTVENAVKVYNDCTEIYWQFLSDENTMYGENVTGTIRLPDGITDIEKLRVWGHGDYNATIKKVSNKEVTLNLPKIKSNTMLEVRIVTEENIYKDATNLYNNNMLEEILAEEQKWADEANAERERAKAFIENLKYIIMALVVVNIFIFIAFMSKRNKLKAVGEELKDTYSYPKSELEYFRDIPDEKNATPARASCMYEFRNNTSDISSNLSKIFSATILNLSLKGLIEFQPVSEKEVRILRGSNTQNASEILSEDELIIYELLKDAMLGNDYITPKQFSKYASKEYEAVYSKLRRLGNIAKDYQKTAGKLSEERMKLSKEWNSKFTLYMVLAVVSIFIAWVLPGVTLGLALLAHACRKNSLYVSILTDKGNKEVEQWKGLKKYMEEYSMLEERLVPDIVLWEKYLVYATTFGISKKVIKQLKAVHPEMFDESMHNKNNFNRCAYWHIMTNPDFGDNYFDNFSRSLANVYSEAQSAYTIAHSEGSSGSGGGGGFSGGGGGRRRRWKLRRTLIL